MSDQDSTTCRYLGRNITETEMRILIGSEMTARDAWTAASRDFHHGRIDATTDHAHLRARRNEADRLWGHATATSNNARRRFVESDGAAA